MIAARIARVLTAFVTAVIVLSAARVAFVLKIICADFSAVFDSVAFLNLMREQRRECGAYCVGLRGKLNHTC